MHWVTKETCTDEARELYEKLGMYLKAFGGREVFGFGTERLYGPALGPGDTRTEYGGMIELLKELTEDMDFTLDSSAATRKLKFAHNVAWKRQDEFHSDPTVENCIDLADHTGHITSLLVNAKALTNLGKVYQGVRTGNPAGGYTTSVDWRAPSFPGEAFREPLSRRCINDPDL